LCDARQCSGCGACRDACPRGCITLKHVANGDSVPVLDASRCIECGLCVRVCPQVNPVQLEMPAACYAAVRKDEAARADSASGGIGALLGERFLEEHPGGAVCGVRWNPDTEHAEYAVAFAHPELEAFKGSKYVQPDAKGIYRNIAEMLKNGRHVLFVGLPCHVAACRQFLDATGVSQEKLACADLLCHGVSSHAFLTEELYWIKKKYRFARLEKLSFRSNRKNRNYHLVVEGSDPNGEFRLYDRAVGEDCYFRAFLDGVSLRESCCVCKFSCKRRSGDLTIGDFIGLGRQKEFSPFEGGMHNVSMVLVNTPKGADALEGLADAMEFWARPYAEAVQGGASLKAPWQRHPERDVFLEEYAKNGFMKAAKSVMGKALLKSRLKHLVLRMANRLGFETEAIVRMIRKGQ